MQLSCLQSRKSKKNFQPMSFHLCATVHVGNTIQSIELLDCHTGTCMRTTAKECNINVLMLFMTATWLLRAWKDNYIIFDWYLHKKNVTNTTLALQARSISQWDNEATNLKMITFSLKVRTHKDNRKASLSPSRAGRIFTTLKRIRKVLIMSQHLLKCHYGTMSRTFIMEHSSYLKKLIWQ